MKKRWEIKKGERERKIYKALHRDRESGKARTKERDIEKAAVKQRFKLGIAVRVPEVRGHLLRRSEVAC